MTKMMSDTETVERAIAELQYACIDENGCDREALDVVLEYAERKLKEEKEPYKWPNP